MNVITYLISISRDDRKWYLTGLKQIKTNYWSVGVFIIEFISNKGTVYLLCTPK